MEINGCSALITGGASGLGEATARLLAANGAKVCIVDLQADKGEALAKEIDGAFVQADVTNPEQVQAAVDAAGAMAPLRINVNCAGIGWAERTVGKGNTPATLEPFVKILQVNLIGTFNTMRLTAAAMAATEPLEFNERGVVVNTASVAAFDGQIGQVAYSASKGGVVGMTLPAARDLSAVGVRVCTIAPGIIDTPLLGLLPDEGRQALAAGVPFPKRLGTSEDYALLAKAIIENGYLNGETIRLDGALRMAPK